jgi:hypothetical protein
LSFFTDSGVAATRVSPGEVSLGTASFNYALFLYCECWTLSRGPRRR